MITRLLVVLVLSGLWPSIRQSCTFSIQQNSGKELLDLLAAEISTNCEAN